MERNLYSSYFKTLLLVVCLLTGTGITVSGQAPVAGFTVNATQGCAPFSVNFTNTSTGASSYQWIFGNGNSSTLTNPQNVYITPGLYSVSLIAIASNGQRDTMQMLNYLTALPGPNVLFTTNQTSGCVEQTTFTFNNQTTDAVSYFWDFDDGTSSLLANPSKVYSSDGNYNVSLLATNNIGCSTVYNIPQSIVVHEVPSAQFTVNSTVTCDPTIGFQFAPDQTNASSYLWVFGDGTTSTQVSPVKAYSTPGIYSVALYLTNSFGCTDTVIKNNYITVHTPAVPQIIAGNTVGCVPFVATYSTNVTNASSYAWSFGNGQTSSNANQNILYTTPGTFSPTLTVTMGNGCSYSTTATNLIQVDALPVVHFTTSNASGCAPLTTSFNNTSTGAASYAWVFSDGGTSTLAQPTHTFVNSGIFWVRLTATSASGCQAQLQVNSAVSVISPIANFTATDTVGCPPLSVQFTNTSSGANTYLWNFGDGTTSTQPNPVHNFQQLGSYDITLMITSNNGCRDTLVMNNLVDVSYQQATYTPPPAITGCAPFGVSFSMAQQPGISYLWNFGDGTTSTSASASHVYADAGTYVVSLVVNDGTPCSTIYPNYQTVIVEGILPQFSVDIETCPPFAVTFEDTTSDAVSWLWDFGDGTSSSVESPVHVFPNTNVHHVGLTTTTASGCVYSYIGFNSVNFASSFASFETTYSPGSFPQSVYFESTNPSATGWLWDFGDGTTSTEENPTHVYQVDAEYNVTLTILTDNCSLTSSGTPFAAEAVEVSEDTASGGSFPNESEVLLEPLRGCAPLNVRFFKQDQSHIVLNWYFGDGSSSTTQNPSHLYTQPGIYSVYYTAITPYGLDTFQYQQSILLGGGMTDFTVAQESYCDYTQVAVSPQNPGNLASVEWSFGDGSMDSTITAVHNFQNANTAYTILMDVVDTLGCRSSIMKSVFISPPVPQIDFPTSICRDTVDFVNSLANQAGYSFLWNFGDGTTSTDASPHHYYTTEGTYSIELTVTHPSGCVTTSVLSHTILVAIPQVGWSLSSSDGCAPMTVTFTNQGSTGNIAWFFSNGNWSLGTWNGSYYSNPVSTTFTEPGDYGFYQRVTSSILPGCFYQVNFPNAIHVHGASADFSFMQSGLCAPFTAQFTDNSPNAVSWLWDFGNGYTSTQQNPLMTFATLPGDSITLTIVNSFGCSATVTKAGLDHFSANAAASFIGACNPLPVSFSSSTTNNISWEWHFGDGTTSNLANAQHTYTQNGVFDAYVIVTSSTNCRDTAHLQVPINVQGPVAHFTSPTPANCAPSVVEFIDSSSNTVSWLWDFGDNTSATIQNPLKLYDAPGVYDIQLIVSDVNGCTDTLMREEYVTVLGPATSFSASAISTCVGATIQFTDLSHGAAEWEWNFGQGSISTSQHPSFTYTQPGSYTITLFSQDTLGCSAFYTIPTPIEIHPYPVAAFTLSDTANCAPLAFTTDNQSVGADSYSWNLGGLSTSTDFEPSYSFDLAGQYDITLVATTVFGCSDTAVYSGMEAYIVPIAAFSISSSEGCTPLAVGFNNTSSHLENPVYSWNFGNNTSSSAFNPEAMYYNPGFYTVSLSVTNASGCSDTISQPSLIQVFDTLPAPISPLQRVTVVNTTSVLIEWEESLSVDFGSYVLYRRNLQSGVFEQIAQITDQHTISYTEIGLNTLDNVYCYKLQTFDRCGYTIEMDSLIEHCTINVEVLTKMDNTIDITWTPYVGKMPQQYRIYRTEESSNNTEDLGTVPGDVTTFNDHSVFCPVKFRYTIKAEALNGQTHVESDSDFDTSDPIANLFADQQVNASRSTVVQNKYVLTEWSRPAIMPERVNGYKVFRSTDNSNFSLVATLSNEFTYYLDEAVDVDHVKYYYRLMATNACGLEGRYGEFSDNVVLKADPAGSFFIKLDWTPYTGWGDNGVGFYIIERQNEDGSWEVIQQVQGNVLSTVDEN